MTLARRLCALVACDDAGKPKTHFMKGGLEVDFVEAIANHLANDGADEVWLRLDSEATSPPSTAPAVGASTRGAMSSKGPNALYGPLAVLERRTFVPVVAWATAPTPADARLLLGFGADRVVVDVNLGLPDPLQFIADVTAATGTDRITAALHVRRFVGDKGVVWELVDKTGQGSGLDAIVLAERLAAVGACEILLVPSVPAPQSERLVHDGELIEQVTSLSSIPVLSTGDDREIADLAAPLLMGADGVVSALFSSGAPTMVAAKAALAGYDLPLRKE